MQNLFSFQTPFKFLKSIHWLWRYNVWYNKTFFHNFDFQMHKTHLKSFVFEILFIGDNSSTFISLMAKFEVYYFFSF